MLLRCTLFTFLLLQTREAKHVVPYDVARLAALANAHHWHATTLMVGRWNLHQHSTSKCIPMFHLLVEALALSCTNAMSSMYNIDVFVSLHIASAESAQG